jgi:hypothetical protein
MSYLLEKGEDLAVIACFLVEEGAYRVTEGLAQNEESGSRDYSHGRHFIG